MSNKVSEIQERAASLIQKTVVPVLDKTIQYQSEFAEELLSIFQTFEIKYKEACQKDDPLLFFESLTTYTNQIYELIIFRYKDNRPRRLDEFLEEYAQAKHTFIQDLPPLYQEVQLEDRFNPLAQDTWRVRRIKQWKRWTRRWRSLPLRIANFFRKLFRKAPKPLKPKGYKVPLRNLTAHFYIEEYAIGLIPMFEKIYRELSITSQQLWQISERVLVTLNQAFQEHAYQHENWLAALPPLDLEAFEATVQLVKKEMQELKVEVLADHVHLIEEIAQKFQYAYERAGTAELPSHKFSNSKIQKESQNTDKIYYNFVQGWRNTLFALHEDWRIDEEFSTLSNHLLLQHFKVRDEAYQKIKQAVLPQVNTAHTIITNALEEIEKAKKQEIEQVLKEQKKYIDLQLIRSIIPATIAVLYRQALPALLENIQLLAKESVEALPERRGLVKTNEYNRVIKSSEIDYVSPRQIISFETLPNLKAKIDTLEKSVNQELTKVQKLINEVGQISYFNLDSALSVFEGEQENKNNAKNIAVEGLQRALKSIEHIVENLDEVSAHLDKDVYEAVKTFIQELTELKSNDYALELKLRVAKARALEQTRALKEKAVDHVRNAIPYTIRFIKQHYDKAQMQVKEYRKQMGIDTASVEVSTEISDFLTETEKSIQQLPYVYQRLFSIRPLDETVFYEERTTELKMLQDAFQNWNKGRFASTVIIGEKGSGITTLINFFLKNSNQRAIKRCQLIRANTFHQIYTPDDLLAYLKQFFPDEHFASMEDVMTYFQQRKQPLIFIFENLEHFYLRKVGGFTCLKLLFELISKTNKQVFWLCSCTLYTWKYLDNTIRISDYFEYEVELKGILNQQLQEVILKRHRVSGYALKYEFSHEDKGKKKFEKWTEEEQQQYLEKEYFKDLNEFTTGNFSIAQLFWLRSALRVAEDTIHIGSLKDYDFSFVKSLTLPHILTLNLLLLHDGLTEEQYQLVTEYQAFEAKETNKIGRSSLNLIQLMDDGFIIKKEDGYVINPLLYRQVVNLLLAKNFLH